MRMSSRQCGKIHFNKRRSGREIADPALGEILVLPTMGKGVGLVYDERMCAHKNVTDASHPERPARIASIYDRLKAGGIVERCVRVEARKATPGELQTVHSEGHVALMQDISSKAYGKLGRKTLQSRYDSIYFNSGSSESALLAAGSVIEVATQVAEGKLSSGACVVRPPGHHAEADSAMGFCLFNNVAVAAHILAHKKKELGVQKLLIVDWDVHHGNGTQHMFWNDPQVLYFSVHRYDNGRFYPPGNGGNFDKVGTDKGEGYNINVPWPHGGFGDADYLAVWEHILMPVAQEFNPDMVLISAGFDSASGDPLGACEVTPEGFYNMTQQLMVLAKGRVVLALEGGYNLNSISNSYLACMQALLGDPSPETPCACDLLPESLPLIKKVRDALKKYWPVLGTELKVKRPVPPTPAPSLSAEEIAKLVMEKDLLSPSSDRKGEVEEPEPEALKDLVGRLSKLSTEERVGTPYDTECVSINSVAAAQQVPEDRKENTMDLGASELDLGMKEIGEDNINVILQLSGGHSATQSGTLREPKGGDRAHLGIRGGPGKSINQVDVPVEVDDDINAKSWSLAVKGEVTDTVDDLPIAEEALPDNSGEESGYIWYLTYGSNMWKPRFMCYISGGQVEGMSRACQGCRDKTPPVASEWLTISNALFFGHESTQMWGLGGVAFLDPIPRGGVSTIARLYKITKQQFNDVFSQENQEKVGKEWVNDSYIHKLCMGGSKTSHLDILEDDWYGTLMYLGDKDGLPILTFTCSESHMEKFRSGEFGTFGPSDSYRAVIAHGLVDDLGISEEKAFNYLLSATIPQKHS